MICSKLFVLCLTCFCVFQYGDLSIVTVLLLVVSKSICSTMLDGSRKDIDILYIQVDQFQEQPQCASGSQPHPSKTTPSFLPSPPPPLNLKTVQAPLFRISPHSILVFQEVPPKRRIFQWTHKFSSLTLSYLLKVTKFLVKISQFKIFVYKLFLSLNISDFILFFL